MHFPSAIAANGNQRDIIVPGILLPGVIDQAVNKRGPIPDNLVDLFPFEKSCLQMFIRTLKRQSESLGYICAFLN